jgi:hypothetical protein
MKVAPRCLTTVKCTLKPDLWLYRSEFSFVCEYVVNLSVYCVVIVCRVNKLVEVIVIDFVCSYSKQNSLGPNPVFVFPHLVQKRRSQLGFVTYLLNYLRMIYCPVGWGVIRCICASTLRKDLVSLCSKYNNNNNNNNIFINCSWVVTRRQWSFYIVW